MITARIGDPTAHRRLMGPIAGRRLDARIAHLPGGTVWQAADTIDGAADDTFETLVTVGAFCAADDLDARIASARRVVAPGGRLLFLEHVSRPGVAGIVNRVADPVWASLPNGCHVDHDLVAALRRGGFLVTDIERFTMPSVVPFLRPWVQGAALRKT